MSRGVDDRGLKPVVPDEALGATGPADASSSGFRTTIQRWRHAVRPRSWVLASLLVTVVAIGGACSSGPPTRADKVNDCVDDQKEKMGDSYYAVDGAREAAEQACERATPQ